MRVTMHAALAAKYPDCEEQRRIFLATVSDDPRFMRMITERAFDDWTSRASRMCTQPQRTRSSSATLYLSEKLRKKQTQFEKPEGFVTPNCLANSTW